MADARGRHSQGAPDGSAAPQDEAGQERTSICRVGFCPICAAVSAMGEVRPELTEHLLLAGREMLLALRELIDARLEGVEERPSQGRVERIHVQ